VEDLVIALTTVNLFDFVQHSSPQVKERGKKGREERRKSKNKTWKLEEKVVSGHHSPGYCTWREADLTAEAE
jgi:hypothetical protein